MSGCRIYFRSGSLSIAQRYSQPLARFYKSLGGSYAVSDDPMPDFRSFCLQQVEHIRELIAFRLVQTNEVSRCAGLAPVLVAASKELSGRPLYLVDIGASAGLNLFWDCYGYKYGDRIEAGDKIRPYRLNANCEEPHYRRFQLSFRRSWTRWSGLESPRHGVKEDALWLRALIGLSTRNDLNYCAMPLPWCFSNRRN